MEKLRDAIESSGFDLLKLLIGHRKLMIPRSSAEDCKSKILKRRSGV